ncbi:hypothetical protein F5X97DRAFT_301321 [Nemania serpens]|nr:hypothetical protein F5X97DRAFT_301321 [Nemania serpens]
MQGCLSDHPTIISRLVVYVGRPSCRMLAPSHDLLFLSQTLYLPSFHSYYSNRPTATARQRHFILFFFSQACVCLYDRCNLAMPSSSPPSPPRSPKNPRHGEFRNGGWLCNCEPRLLAKMRTGTTNTKNHGKKFYVCPKDRMRENTCDMFLLLEEAQERAREHLMTNGRSEKRQTTLLESMMTPRRRAGEPAAAAAAGRNPDEPPATGATSTLRGNGEPPRSADFYDTTSDEDDYGEETKSKAKDEGAMSGGVGGATPMGAGAGGAKRKRSSRDEDFLDELSSAGEEEWVAVTEMSTKSTGTRGGGGSSSRHRDAFATPSAMRATNVENGMATPSLTKGKSVKKVLFKDVETGEGGERGERSERERRRRRADAGTAKRRRFDDYDNDGEMAGPSTSTSVRLWGTDATIGSSPPPPSSSESSTRRESPTPRNPAAAATATATAPRGADPANLTREVMDLLRDQDVPGAVRDEVRKTLEKHANQAKGFERGRDAARKAAKEAEDRGARLQARVEELEALERSRQEVRQEVRNELMGIYGKI